MTPRPMNPAQRYLASFPADAVVEFPVLGLDVVDTHLHSAALHGEGGGSGLGYGATAGEARTGALGEMAEAVLSARGLAGAPRAGSRTPARWRSRRAARTTTIACCSGCR
jgi:hypothetical protein